MPGDGHIEELEIDRGWRITRTAPNAADAPDALRRDGVIEDAIVPGTVASTLLREPGRNRLAALDLDDFDWWYECDFDLHPADDSDYVIQFDGLATIAEVWLNGERILASRNMFREYRVAVGRFLKARNTLAIAFRSVSQDLGTRRPRPRWKTNLVANQQLRWIRTTLLGRIPGWTPAIPAVGPWRRIRLQKAGSFVLEGAEVTASSGKQECFVDCSFQLRLVDRSLTVEGATISLLGRSHPLDVTTEDGRIGITGRADVPGASLWWPHTHGTPNRHAYEVRLRSSTGEIVIKRGRLGFRSVALDRRDGRIAIVVNGRAVFARGACWSSNDIVALDGDAEQLKQTLLLFRDAGANMIRVGGTMVYESDAFYDICDELGLLVWQDFMFANMDYPVDDDEFRADVAAEVEQQVRRLHEHPCLAVMCGNSEVEQQAAMWGRPRDVWQNRLFYELIPASIERNGLAVPYFASSPCEGALPFHNDTGISHYFGVGAYKRPLHDAQSANVKFAAECLGFSNIPDSPALIEDFGSPAPVVHDPGWKAGIPRDSAAGWDFEDIRDHYLETLYGLDPVELRYADRERYIALSTVVTGEVMERVFACWRQSGNPCGGALIWFMKDLVPGAGWGMFDSRGRPKPVYYFLKRSWARFALALTDRGLDGILGCVVNESADDRAVTIVVELLRNSRTTIARESRAVTVNANSSFDFSVDEMLGIFFDVSYAYRFGPPKHDVVVASVLGESEEVLATSCWFPNGHDLQVFDTADVKLDSRVADDGIELTLGSDRFLKNVCLTAAGYRFSDNYFDLAPNSCKTVVATTQGKAGGAFRPRLQATNLAAALALG